MEEQKEILLEIPKTKWPELRSLYRNDWPKNAVAFCLINTKINYPDFVQEYNFKIYCSDGDINNGMIAIIDKDNYELMIHPLDVKKMEEALFTTKIIDWSRNITVASASPTVKECLKIIKLKLDMVGDKAIKYILNKSSAKFDKLSIPPNTYLDKLRPEHLKLIDETWIYHNKYSFKMFELLMKNNLTYVLYSENHEPVVWITVNTAGALTHLFCLEEHRRKGYAEYVLKIAINDQLDKGNDVIAYALENNKKSQTLFKKIKFKKFGCDEWLFINRKI